MLVGYSVLEDMHTSGFVVLKLTKILLCVTLIFVIFLLFFLSFERQV